MSSANFPDHDEDSLAEERYILACAQFSNLQQIHSYFQSRAFDLDRLYLSWPTGQFVPIIFKLEIDAYRCLTIPYENANQLEVVYSVRRESKLCKNNADDS